MPVKAAPKIRIPGRGPGRNVPNGVIIGRQPGLSGRGPLEILDLIALKAMGVAASKQVNQQLAQAGFRFYAGGLLLANEDIGQGTWSHDVTFENGIEGSSITSLFPANASAVFNIYNIVSGVPVNFGTITFAGGSQTGVLNFPALYVVAAGTPVRLNAPNPADSTLATVSGTVMGFRS